MVAGTARPDRDQDQVDADVAATRDRLVSAVEALVDRVHPQRIKQREVEGAKHFAQTELETLKLLVFNAAGELRTERLTKAGGGAAGFLGVLLVLRSLVTRNRTRSTGESSMPTPSKRAARRGVKASRATEAVADAKASAVATVADGPAEGAVPATRSGRKARRRAVSTAVDGVAEVGAPVAARSGRQLRAATAPVEVDDVETRVRRARKKA